MKIRSIGFVILFGMLATFCAPGAAPSNSGASVSTNAQTSVGPKGDATKGRNFFIGTCAACHGADGKGVAGLGKDLTKSEFARKLSDGELVLFIAIGRPASDSLNTTKVDMPPRGGNPSLKDQDLADIVAFIRSLQK